jgi:hypothetical protein
MINAGHWQWMSHAKAMAGRPFAGAIAAILALTAWMLLGSAPTSVASSNATPFTIPLDTHDGMVADFGGTYYAYGTSYACGFRWYIANTPWCGFKVSTAPSLSGPWSTPKLLFSPSSIDPWTGKTWQVECGSTGQGCFNPRMIQRSGWGVNDGTFLLWFNSALDWSRNHTNAYNAMGCTGPAGPCGPGAPGHGSYTKPSLHFCTGNGDFGIINSGTAGRPPALVCTQPGASSLSVEQLNWWGVGGQAGAGANSIAGLSSIEGPGGYYDRASGKYVITYSDGNCGYCAGTATGYATASSLLGPYTAPANVAAANPPVGGRRNLSASTCGGQSRTVSVVDGQPYQGIDLWTGSRNETTAGVLYEPLQYLNPSNTAGDGQPWQPFTAWTC